MKGIVMQRGERKSIVLFNNGKIGEIPTGTNCEEGMVVTVSYNRRLIILVSVMSCIVIICAIFAFRSVYYDPFGYVQINYGNAAVELAYNRFQRIVAVRPLNREAVEPITMLLLDNSAIETAYEKIMLSFTRAVSLPAQSPLFIRIAQDNLAGAKKIEQSLSPLSSSLTLQSEPGVTFELYTLELYREAMTKSIQNPAISPMPPDGSGQQMHHRRQNRGMRNTWCW